AVFGSLLLTNYHHDFAKAIPRGGPQEATTAFSNPLMLAQLRPQLEATFSRLDNGPRLLETLHASGGPALLCGIQWSFLIRAGLMNGRSILTLLLKAERLRHAPPPPAAQA